MKQRTRRRFATVAAAAGLASVAFVTTSSGAWAHPLGNATVNSADQLIVGTDSVAITHILDLAEIPTLQATSSFPSQESAGKAVSVDDGALARYATQTCAAHADKAQLVVNGQPAVIAPLAQTVELRAGQAELQTLRIECQWSATDLPAITAVTFTAAPIDVAGWREVTATGDRTMLFDSDVPASSPTSLLRQYPAVEATDVPRTETAAFQVRVGGPAYSPASAEQGGATSTPTDSATRWLGGLIDGATSPLGAIISLLLAAAVGAFHALTPGHGKTAVAFAIAGQERSARSAMTVGATVTASHTASVLVLGAVVASTTAIAPTAWYPVIGTVSGAVVVFVGIMLLRRALRGERGHVHLTSSHQGSHQHEKPHVHAHSPGHEHAHGHDHSHDHDHSNEHQVIRQHQTVAVLEKPPSTITATPQPPPPRRQQRPVTPRGTLVALGIAGGVVPSPSALLVLLGAAAIGQAWWGVLLVVAFGVGMALTLAAAGMLAWRVGERVSTWASGHQHPAAVRLVSALPVIAATAICGAGVIVMARSVGIWL